MVKVCSKQVMSEITVQMGVKVNTLINSALAFAL